MIPTLTLLLLLDINLDAVSLIIDKLPFETLWNLSLTCKVLNEIVLQHHKFKEGMELLSEIHNSRILLESDNYKVVNFFSENNYTQIYPIFFLLFLRFLNI